MAATTGPISGLTALATAPAVGDLFVIVDISDPTQGPSGTTKKVTTATIFTSPAFTGTVTAAAITASGNVGVAGTTSLVVVNTTGLITVTVADANITLNATTGNPLLLFKRAGVTTAAWASTGSNLVSLLDSGGAPVAAFSGGNLSLASIAATAGLTSSGATGAGIGYATGAGGAVTQASNRTTGVTLNTLSGAITTATASLAAGSQATFVVTNSTTLIGDCIGVVIRSGSNGGNTKVLVVTVTNGSFSIQVCNDGVSPETGAIVINFTTVRGVSA